MTLNATARQCANVEKTVCLATLAASVAFSAGAHEEPAKLPTYASVRVETSVKAGPPPATDRPRPEDYFQLAGGADKKLCGEVLDAFNQRAGSLNRVVHSMRIQRLMIVPDEPLFRLRAARDAGVRSMQV